MAWITALRGQVVGLDTAPLIYFIEENPVYLHAVRRFFAAAAQGELHIITSTVTLLEILVHPFRQGDTGLADQYREILLNSNGLSCVPLSGGIAEEAARLRSEHSIRTPDAIQIATAIRGGATSFLTNDSRLPSLPGLEMLVLHELVREIG